MSNGEFTDQMALVTDATVEGFLQLAACSCPSLSEIWLFGSRANPPARSDSDWDLLFEGPAELYDELKAVPLPAGPPNIDGFCYGRETHLSSPWVEGRINLLNNLTAVSEHECTYEPGDPARRALLDGRQSKALRLWCSSHPADG